jgi:hypothetical protein
LAAGERGIWIRKWRGWRRRFQSCVDEGSSNIGPGQRGDVRIGLDPSSEQAVGRLLKVWHESGLHRFVVGPQQEFRPIRRRPNTRFDAARCGGEDAELQQILLRMPRLHHRPAECYANVKLPLGRSANLKRTTGWWFDRWRWELHSRHLCRDSGSWQPSAAPNDLQTWSCIAINSYRRAVASRVLPEPAAIGKGSVLAFFQDAASPVCR